MLAQMTHILPVTTLVRKRLLPLDGQIFVKEGQKIAASDTIGETVINRKHIVVDVASILRVAPSKADAFIKVKRGQKVAKGDLLAETTGLVARSAKSPASGRVIVAGGGKIVLLAGGTQFQLKSGLAGVVTEIIPNRGAVVRATGSLIQGMWGNGLADTGVLLSLLDRPDDVLESSRMDVSMRAAMILGGHVADLSALKMAAELPVRGLILGSMSPGLIQAALQAPFPILVIEGFGKRPVNSIAFKLLTTNAKREISILAETDRQHGVRPELIIPLPVSQEPPEPDDQVSFTPGQTVRVCYLSRPSQVGSLIQILSGNATLSNGVRALSAEVRLETGEQVIVPLNNLEVLG